MQSSIWVCRSLLLVYWSKAIEWTISPSYMYVWKPFCDKYFYIFTARNTRVRPMHDASSTDNAIRRFCTYLEPGQRATQRAFDIISNHLWYKTLLYRVPADFIMTTLPTVIQLRRSFSILFSTRLLSDFIHRLNLLRLRDSWSMCLQICMFPTSENGRKQCVT